MYCHVSGEERWLAPPLLRNYIFQREMPLVQSSVFWHVCLMSPTLKRCIIYQGFPLLQSAACCRWWILTGRLVNEDGLAEGVEHAVQVLDTILHADRALFQQSPCLAEAAVVVHLSSHLTVGPCLTADYMLYALGCSGSSTMFAHLPRCRLVVAALFGNADHNTSCTGLTLWSQ